MQIMKVFFFFFLFIVFQKSESLYWQHVLLVFHSQAFHHVELWSIWLSGFFLIILSLYATQKLLPPLKDHNRISNFNKNAILDSKSLSITIFTAPKPFIGSTGIRQKFAVQSWLALSPYVSVVLFSQHPSVPSFASAFDSRVFVDTDIDFT